MTKPNLSPDETALLLQRLRERLRSARNSSTITPRANSDPAPLSFAQERLWFLENLYPGQTTYNESSAYRLTGSLDKDALQAALGGIVRRQEILRTTYHSQDGLPVQVVGPPQEVALSLVDLAQIPDEARVLAAQGQFVNVIEQPFDLSRDLMLRFCLYRLHSEDHILLAVRQHIASDGWSSRLFWQELFELYTAELLSIPAQLAPLPIQYADYALWQREWLQGERLESQLAYWRRQLANLPVMDLPSDRPRPQTMSYQGAGERFKLDPDLVDRLRFLAREENSTLYMVLLTAYTVLMARYTGQDDIAVGTPTANRKLLEIEPLIGYFANTLVMRVDLSENPSFRTLLRQVRQTAIAAYDHQDIPFEKLVQALKPERHLNRVPLVATNFQLVDLPEPHADIPGLTVDMVDVPSLHAKFDMECSLVVNSNEISGHWIYATDLFQADTVQRMIGHFQTLLKSITVDLDCPIGNLPLLTETERQQILVDWNGNAAIYPTTHCIHELFKDQAERTPDAVALVYGKWSLTYRQLNSRANQLAHHLISLGIRPEVKVGLFLDRTPDLVVAILGILKAGGTYVPIDPANPRERIAFKFDDAAFAVIITEKSLRDQLPNRSITYICVEEVRSDLDRLPVSAPVVEMTPDHAAYMVYTSGSTGQPNGVIVTHANVVRLFQATNHWFSFGSEDVWTLFHTTAFDFSVWELWGALFHGGRLVIISYEVSRSPHDFYHLLCEQGVTILNQTPTAFLQLLKAEGDMGVDPKLALRTIIFGGEELVLDHLRLWYARHGDNKPQLINMYGITETTIHVTYQPLNQAMVEMEGGSPIGVPIPDLQVYVLDQHRQLVPIGVPGVLYVGGPAVARGYHNQPDLTSERFIDNPFQPGARIYCSGDLVSWRTDGTLQYLGRIDNQVKIRGFRVELGELEATLRKHPAVDECTVLAREDKRGDKRLVAYWVGHISAEATERDLMQHMRRFLSDHLMPASIVQLDGLPLTLNGKIDRQALPAPDPARLNRTEIIVMPRTAKEEAIAALWIEVLGRQHVGIHDNFFELGGHSLLATQLISRIEQGLGVRLPLRMLFEEPTIAGLAGLVAVSGSLDEDQIDPSLSISQVDKQGKLPLSFSQERLWVLDQLYPGQSTYNEAFALRLAGSLDMAALKDALNSIVQRHEIVRTTYHTEYGIPAQRIHPPREVPLNLFDLSHKPASTRLAEAQRRFSDFRERPFDLSRDLMWRACLYRLESDDHIFLLVRHHIASDGWSIRLEKNELFELYNARIERRLPQLPELAIQYADYARWQREWLQGERLEHGLQYWREQLAGLPPLELMADRKRPQQPTQRGAGQYFLLEASLVKELRALAKESGATLYMLLLTGFKILLQRYSGQNDFAVGTPTANRRPVEIEPLIGFFANTLVIRSDLSGNPSVRELIHRVRKVVLEALEHQDIPFDKLVEEMQPERHLNRNPLVSTAFQFIELPSPKQGLVNLAQESLDVPSLRAKFDIYCTLKQSDSIRGHWQYSTELFEAGTAQRMIGHFQILLEGIVANPDQPINSLPLLTGAERQRILVDWNNTQTKYPADQCIHQLFETQVERTPDAVALLFEGQQMTYRELNGRANQLAHYLRALGVGPDALVAICVERSLEMIVGLLAILKAGGAYVPLDPAYPPARLAFMLQDTQPKVLLTQQKLLEQLPEIADQRQTLSTIQNPLLFCLDSDWETIAQESESSVDNWTMSHNLAYVMYTSGSTGRPKGVSVTHQAVVSLVKETDFAELTTEELFLQFSPLSFDASTFEIWGSLLNGAQLVIFPPYKPSLQELGQVIGEQGITTLWLTAVLFQQMVDERLEDLRNVRQLLAGGDVLSPAHVHKISQALPTCRVINGYGPTESTTFTCCYPVHPDSPIGPSLPIGRPIANRKGYVLDPHLQPVPVGVPAELYIGGAGLARGYFNRPELTAESFIPNPFGSDAGARLYKTGDLVRYLPDGNLEFLGRIDDQVKIRGYRIEPGEIELVLGQHPGVQNCVVLARMDKSGDKILVAYVVPTSGPLRVKELRYFLKQQLPEYMVPSAFMMLETLPMTPSGKIDRHALPTPDRNRPELEDDFTPSQSPMEQQIAAIWSEVLDLEQIGRHDNFFELGGHSLLAMRVVSRITQQFKIHLPLRILFEKSTVAGLAQHLQNIDRSSNSDTKIGYDEYVF